MPPKIPAPRKRKHVGGIAKFLKPCTEGEPVRAQHDADAAPGPPHVAVVMERAPASEAGDAVATMVDDTLDNVAVPAGELPTCVSEDVTVQHSEFETFDDLSDIDPSQATSCATRDANDPLAKDCSRLPTLID